MGKYCMLLFFLKIYYFNEKFILIFRNALCEENIRLRNSKELKCQPGCNMDETLEANILKQLSGIRDSVGKACLQELHFTNGPLIMALSGSKGIEKCYV